jgi:HD-GYP domain-containing protein (c-di-GMP phosphodiesterase class II)
MVAMPGNGDRRSTGSRPDDGVVRAAELLAAVSTATDFAKGLPEEQALRTCRIAMRVAEIADLDEQDSQAVFYLSLLRFIGCTATAPEMAAALGDELAVSATFVDVDARDIGAVFAATRRLYADDRLPTRVLESGRFLASAPRVVREHEVASCEVGYLFATKLGLPRRVASGLRQVFERFDGKGNPGLFKGDGIGLPVRVEQVANLLELATRTSGWDDALAVIGTRAGSILDPRLVALVLRSADELRPAAEEELDQQAVLALEPAPAVEFGDAALDAALTAVGAVADLKSAYTRGHSGAVSARAATVASMAGLPAGEVELARRAGWVHDLGKVATSASIWDKDGPLNATQFERVRMHPYVSERVLARCPALEQVAAVAGAHHERIDGSGYHRGARALKPVATIVAAADMYEAMSQPRAQRPPLPPRERNQLMCDQVTDGRLPDWVVDAILDAPRGSTTASQTGLTERQLDVLAQVARGATNRQTAEALHISPKTVNAHLEQIFTRLGVTTRGAAAFYAIEQGLLSSDD